MTAQYIYRVTEVVKVTDGDTYWFRLDVGFRGTLLVNIRLSGWDCPERHKGSAFERAQAAVATEAAQRYLEAPGGLWVQTQPDPDDFGRWLGDVWNESGTHLGDYLAALELATPWPTRWHEVYDKPST